MEEKKPEAAFPDLAALALGSLLSQKGAPRRERTKAERDADRAAMLAALEQAMQNDET